MRLRCLGQWVVKVGAASALGFWPGFGLGVKFLPGLAPSRHPRDRSHTLVCPVSSLSCFVAGRTWKLRALVLFCTRLGSWNADSCDSCWQPPEFGILHKCDSEVPTRVPGQEMPELRFRHPSCQLQGLSLAWERACVDRTAPKKPRFSLDTPADRVTARPSLPLPLFLSLSSPDTAVAPCLWELLLPLILSTEQSRGLPLPELHLFTVLKKGD